jgi:hypothetical protein
MNLPSTTLASNPVARSSIARTSTSVTPRCSMRNSAWPVNERSQFHHSGKAGIEPLGRPIVAPGHRPEVPSDLVRHGRARVERPWLNWCIERREHGGGTPPPREVFPPRWLCDEISSWSTSATRERVAHRTNASPRVGCRLSPSGGSLPVWSPTPIPWREATTRNGRLACQACGQRCGRSRHR